MPRTSFATENRLGSSGPKINKLKLDKDERVRINIGLDDPVTTFVHRLQKPHLENGKPVFVNEKKFGKDEVVMKMDFVANPQCLGRFDVLEKDGRDPENCVVCRYAAEHPDRVEPPSLRVAVNIFQYRTKPGGFEVATPFSGEVKVWSMTPRKFDKIVDIANEFGDLRNHDLLLGPCENKVFQNFEIQGAPKSAMLATPEATTFVEDSMSSQKVEDLDAANGFKKEPGRLQMDLNDITKAYQDLARADGSIQHEQPQDANLQGDLNEMLKAQEAQAAQAPAAPAAEAPATGGTASMAGLLAEATQPAAAEAPASEPAASSEDGAVDDFAALLAQAQPQK